MNHNIRENSYPHSSKSVPDSSTHHHHPKTPPTCLLANNTLWTAINTTYCPPELLWEEIAALLKTQKIPPKRYKAKFLELRNIDQIWLHLMWLHRFSGHYFEPDGRRPTAKDHRESFKAYLANLKKLGAEHYIQMLTELRLAAYQDKLAAMRVRYGD